MVTGTLDTRHGRRWKEQAKRADLFLAAREHAILDLLHGTGVSEQSGLGHGAAFDAHLKADADGHEAAGDATKHGQRSEILPDEAIPAEDLLHPGVRTLGRIPVGLHGDQRVGAGLVVLRHSEGRGAKEWRGRLVLRLVRRRSEGRDERCLSLAGPRNDDD